MDKGTCAVAGCDRPVKARGWCQGHYARQQRHGDVQADRPLLTAIPAGKSRCAKCEAVLPLDQFGASHTRPRGVKSWCRLCERELITTKWKRGRDDYQRRWRAENRDKTREYARRYDSANVVKKTASRARMAAARPEVYAAIARASDANRRARERNAPGYSSTEQIRARWAYYADKCWICRAPATETDHVKPLAKGGAHWPSNLRPICRTCNSMKRAKWPFDVEEVRRGRAASRPEGAARPLAPVPVH